MTTNTKYRAFRGDKAGFRHVRGSSGRRTFFKNQTARRLRRVTRQAMAELSESAALLKPLALDQLEAFDLEPQVSLGWID
jgi:hypothetical protein